jgi:hypothetical protein
MVKRKLLGARVRTQLRRGKRRLYLLASYDWAQVIPQCFSLLAEAGLHEFQKPFFFARPANTQLGSFARKRHLDQRRLNLRRRTKGAGRKLERYFRLGVELGRSRQIPVLTPSGLGHDSFGDFELNDDVN